MLQCGLVRSNFAFAISRLSLLKGRYQPNHSAFRRTDCSGKLAAPAPLDGIGAGDGNRTHVASLEGWCSTIELHPPGITVSRQRTSQTTPVSARSGAARRLVEGVGFEPT